MPIVIIEIESANLYSSGINVRQSCKFKILFHFKNNNTVIIKP